MSTSRGLNKTHSTKQLSWAKQLDHSTLLQWQLGNLRPLLCFWMLLLNPHLCRHCDSSEGTLTIIVEVSSFLNETLTCITQIFIYTWVMIKVMKNISYVYMLHLKKTFHNDPLTPRSTKSISFSGKTIAIVRISYM